MSDDTDVLSLLDVLPTTFAQLPDTLTPAEKTRAAQRMHQVPTIREWLENNS